MKHRYLIFPLLLSLIFYSSCYKCHDEQLSTMVFSQADLAINPYVNGNQVTFISSTEDTLNYKIFRRMDRDAFFENQGTDYFALHGCKGRWYFSDYNKTDLSAHDNSWIGINLSFVDSYSRPGTKLIQFFLSFSDTAIAELNVPLKFDSGVLMNSEDYSYFNSHLEGLFDTIRLGPNVYHNVYKITNEPQFRGRYKNNWVENFYYSTSEGVVGFTLKNSKYYYLSK
ncbi:MAG: hypothetical protein ACOYNC_12460 [Bacteroidales bacterium]